MLIFTIFFNTLQWIYITKSYSYNSFLFLSTYTCVVCEGRAIMHSKYLLYTSHIICLFSITKTSPLWRHSSLYWHFLLTPRISPLLLILRPGILYFTSLPPIIHQTLRCAPLLFIPNYLNVKKNIIMVLSNSSTLTLLTSLLWWYLPCYYNVVNTYIMTSPLQDASESMGKFKKIDDDPLMPKAKIDKVLERKGREG